MKALFRLLTFLSISVALLSSPQIGFAQSVGRTEVKDLPQSWRRLVTYEKKGLSLDSGTSYIPMEGGAFVNGAGDMLLIVESTTGGNSKNVNWVTMKCPAPRNNYFTNDYGSNQTPRDTRCLVVNTRYSDKTYLEQVSPQTAVAVTKENLKFESGQLIRAWSGLRGGTFLKVFLFKTSSIKMASGANATEQELVALGESLQKAVYDSTLSISGSISLELLNTIR